MQVVVKPLVLEEWCSSSGGGIGGKEGGFDHLVDRGIIKRGVWA